ncbi:hypothetical protein QO011_005765 [Labrys wisconsinensis]|uniref:Uncharacterized protein n=1 Tax=Labrys wisconsinensis TaxID=425677 RepID=A0ABU0JEN3_9HYPH|nr:hypothetical protein [Labrys wisconsinensis]
MSFSVSYIHVENDGEGLTVEFIDDSHDPDNYVTRDVAHEPDSRLSMDRLHMDKNTQFLSVYNLIRKIQLNIHHYNRSVCPENKV